nr:hypothetical protein [Tanacetum cinerariifolium]
KTNPNGTPPPLAAATSNKHPLIGVNKPRNQTHHLGAKSSQTNTPLGFLVGGGLWCRGSGGGGWGDERWWWCCRWWCGVVSVWRCGKGSGGDVDGGGGVRWSRWWGQKGEWWLVALRGVGGGVVVDGSGCGVDEWGKWWQPSEWNTHVVKTEKKITINGSDTASFDKSKVECYNCHKIGYFARDCRGPRNQDSRNSYMAEDEVSTNMALIDFSESEIYTNNTCLKTCLKSYETLKKQYDDLRIEFNKSEFNLVAYKKGLAFVVEQLVFYKTNETTLCENIVVLTRDVSIKDSKINVLKSQLEKIKQEKEGIQLKIENFDNASKSLDKLLGSQITNKSKNGLGFQSYNVVSPPASLVYNPGRCLPPKTYLSYSGLEEFKQPQFESYGLKSCKKESKNANEDIPNELKEYPDAHLVKDRVLDNKDCSVESPVVVEKKTSVPTIAKVEVVRQNQQEKPVRKTIKYAEMYRSHGPRETKEIGISEVPTTKKERVVSGNNFTRVTYNNSTRKTHPSAHRNMAPREILMKTGLRPLNTARPVNTAHPKTTDFMELLLLSDKMEAGSTTTTMTAKLPILNPGEYDLWLMRIEQYFLMTHYSLWEVIQNGNKVLKRTVGTVEQIYEPTSIEEKLDRKSEIKARGTLLMALPNKDQLKFHSYKDAKLLMEAIEKRYRGNKESKM